MHFPSNIRKYDRLDREVDHRQLNQSRRTSLMVAGRYGDPEGSLKMDVMKRIMFVHGDLM